MDLKDKIVGLALACLIALIGWQLHQTWSLKEEVLKLQQGQKFLSQQIKKNTNFIKRNIKSEKKNKRKIGIKRRRRRNKMNKHYIYFLRKRRWHGRRKR